MRSLCPIRHRCLAGHPNAAVRPHQSRQSSRSPGSNSQLLPQSFGRRRALVKLPVPGIKQPSLRQQRIVVIVQPLARRLPPAPSPLPLKAIRAVHQQLHRQQQRYRRPPSDQHRLPLQSRGCRNVRSQGNRDTQKERRPHRASGPASVGPGRLQQADRGQEQEAVHGQRPQRGADRVRPTLRRELPLMNIRGVGRHPGNHESTQRTDPRIEIEAPAPGDSLPGVGGITHQTHHWGTIPVHNACTLPRELPGTRR